MNVQSSSISLASNHRCLSEKQIDEQLVIRRNNRNQNPHSQVARDGSDHDASLSLNISHAALSSYETQFRSVSTVTSVEGSMDVELMQTKALLESLLGQKIDLIKYEINEPEAPEVTQKQNQRQRPGVSDGVSMAYTRREAYHEEEETSFSANGTVRTEDGREISFDVQLAMKRSFDEETRVTLRMGDEMIDPLVLNFSGRPADLLDETILFDLDSDGEMEAVHKLAPDSAYLVYDRNGDGIANNGSELFGPSTGSGFAELAQFDEDHNGFIDESDSVFDQLGLWNQAGQGSYRTLGEAGVGAIYLANASTDMQLNNTANDRQGAIRETGIYLNEDGSVGTIQEIDLVASEFPQSEETGNS
jgi:hypothetical protein